MTFGVLNRPILLLRTREIKKDPITGPFLCIRDRDKYSANVLYLSLRSSHLFCVKKGTLLLQRLCVSLLIAELIVL